MNFVLVYFSRRGNTRQVAKAIAQELGINPIDVNAIDVNAIDVNAESPNVADADMLVIGSGTYGGKPGKEMVNFLKNLSFVTGKKAACFATCATSAKRTLKTMQETLTKKGYTVVDNFSCFGQYGTILAASRIGHPTAKELNQAREWARKLKT